FLREDVFRDHRFSGRFGAARRVGSSHGLLGKKERGWSHRLERFNLTATAGLRKGESQIPRSWWVVPDVGGGLPPDCVQLVRLCDATGISVHTRTLYQSVVSVVHRDREAICGPAIRKNS